MSWVRQAWGLPSRPSERERFISRTWLAVQASRRREQAEADERRRLRELPQKQAEQIARYQAMQRDPFTQRIKAEAAQLAARQRAEAARIEARIHREALAEAEAREVLRTQYDQGTDITRMAEQGVSLPPDRCDFVHPHSGPCQPRITR